MTFSLILLALLAQAPVRDAAQESRTPPPPAGSGKVTVLVITRDGQTTQPIRRASVVLTNTLLGINRAEVTDDDGKFTFDRLPAGRYMLEAGKGGYVRMVFGARRYDTPGTPIAVADGQHVDNLTIECPRGAVIAGTVLDMSGRPVNGTSIALMQYRMIDGVRKLTPPAAALRTAGALAVSQTDQTGSYRLYGLPAGEYVVRAAARLQIPAGATGAPTFIQSQTYFPGTAEPAAAQGVRVAAGEERAGVDFRLQSVPASNVSGTVSTAGGAAPRNVRVVMVPDGPYVNGVMTGADGRFSIGGVPPGQYTIWARSIPTGTPIARDDPGPALWGTTSIAAGGGDLNDVAIAMQPSMAASGRVVFESAASQAPAVLAGMEVVLAPVPGVISTLAVLRIPVRTDGRGAFATSSLTPGKYTIQVVVPGSTSTRWTVKSAIARGRDVMDFPIEIGPNETLNDIVVTLTDAAQEISGVFSDAAGNHPAGFTLVAFSEDSSFWTPASRRIRLAQPATDGRFAIAGLPAGSYRLAAVRELGPDDANDPAFLQQLVPASIPVTLAPGERKIQDVRIQ